MSKAKTLDEARIALRTAHLCYDEATETLYAALVAKDYAASQAGWKEAHDAVLGLKGSLNGLYSHLAELKPKKADKLKPGGKIDRPEAGPDGAPEKSNKAKGRGRKAAEFKSNRRREKAPTETITEAASDEP